MLKVTDNGFEDIIVSHHKSKKVKSLSRRVDYNAISIDYFIALIIELPDLLRDPIVFDENKLLAGFNKEELRKFLPRIR